MSQVPDEPDGNQETRTRGTEIAAMERREAPALFKRGRGKTEDWCATRCSIPSALRGENEEEDGLPGAAKNTGGGALASP